MDFSDLWTTSGLLRYHCRWLSLQVSIFFVFFLQIMLNSLLISSVITHLNWYTSDSINRVTTADLDSNLNLTWMWPTLNKTDVRAMFWVLCDLTSTVNRQITRQVSLQLTISQWAQFHIGLRHILVNM